MLKSITAEVGVSNANPCRTNQSTDSKTRDKWAHENGNNRLLDNGVFIKRPSRSDVPLLVIPFFFFFFFFFKRPSRSDVPLLVLPIFFFFFFFFFFICGVRREARAPLGQSCKNFFFFFNSSYTETWSLDLRISKSSLSLSAYHLRHSGIKSLQVLILEYLTHGSHASGLSRKQRPFMFTRNNWQIRENRGIYLIQSMIFLLRCVKRFTRPFLLFNLNCILRSTFSIRIASDGAIFISESDQRGNSPETRNDPQSNSFIN